MTVDTIRRSGVPLGFDLSPKSQTIAFPLLPALEDVRSEGIKRTLPLTTFFRFGKGSSRKPSLHRAPTEAKLLRNGWWLHSLLLQLHDLLIAGLSACSSSQTNFLHIRWFWRAPFFDGNDGFVLLILAWLVWFLFCQNLGLTASQKHLNSFGQVFDDVKPVSALNGLGSAFVCGRGIFSSSITTDHRQIWLITHPLC